MTPVPSPCRNICTLDPSGTSCTACGRTLEEITAWPSLDDAGRRRVWQRLAPPAQPAPPEHGE